VDKSWAQVGSIASFVLTGLITYLAGVRGLTFIGVTFAIFFPVAWAMGMLMTKLFGLPVVPVAHGPISRLGEYDD
jgi:hypothetical protein